MRWIVTPLAAAAAICAFTAVPALASGTSCHTPPPPPPSAYNVYVEQVPPAQVCTKPKPKPVHHPSSGPTTTTVQPYVAPPVSLPATVTKKLKHARPKDAKLLTKVATNPAYGAAHAVKLIRTSAPTLPPPSAVGAAFDLGAGPTALFAVLLTVAALLAVGGGLGRGRR